MLNLGPGYVLSQEVNRVHLALRLEELASPGFDVGLDPQLTHRKVSDLADP